MIYTAEFSKTTPLLQALLLRCAMKQTVSESTVRIIVKCTQGGASSEFEWHASRESLEDPQSRLGHSTLGIKWREFDGRGAVLRVQWQCCLAAAEAVANWMLGEQDLVLPRASARFGHAVLHRETLELWQYIVGEDWRLSTLLQVDCGGREGSRLWFGSERAAIRTAHWIKDDVLSSLHSLQGSPDHLSPEQPWSFKPLGKLADMAAPRHQHFLFLPREFCFCAWSMAYCSRHIRYSAHYSSCMAYLAAIECPDRGEQTRADVAQLFEQFDLSAVWGRATVVCETTRGVEPLSISRGDLAAVHMLSITYPEQYSTPVSKKSNSGHQRSRRVRGGRVARGIDASQRWVVKQR